MENCYSLQESDLLHEIIKAIKRNEHGLLDYIVQDILKDQDLRSLINREIEIEKEPEEPEKAMVIKIDLSREGVPNNTFRLYLSGTGTILIDWGDGNSLEVDLDTSTDDFYEHEYEITGKYIIKVYGQEDFPEQEISFGSGALLDNYYNRAIEEIESWGDLRLVSLSGALSYTMGPLTVPKELPETVTNLSYFLRGSTISEVINMQNWNTSNVTDMSHMFREAENFNGDLSSWNTSSVENMRWMFARAISFDGDISDWNTSNVTDMSSMFFRATSFNRYIGDWDTSSVENMRSMFALATSFDRDISEWDTSKVIDMSYMFYRAENFNQNIGGWNTENVVDMISMFNRATKFKQDIGGWNTENVKDMSFMFYNATDFNQDIGGWDTGKVENMEGMFNRATKFNQDIGGWDTGKVTNMRTMFARAEEFNQDIGEWDVSSVTNMMFMFAGATKFNQDLSGWCVENITSKPDDFDAGAGFQGQGHLQPDWEDPPCS